MQSKRMGFTLIELVIVIIILGILSAVAIPKFIDLSGDARTAAVSGVAGALASANGINYISRKENSANGVAVATCASVANALQGGLPSGYSISPATAVSVDATVTCTVVGPGSVTATFTATGIT